MEKLPLPELGTVLILFLLTLIICYCIWYILFGKRFPLKERKKTVKKVDKCTLNEIMGYDFIQIKNVKSSAQRQAPVPEKEETKEKDAHPALYATTSISQHNEETEDADNAVHETEKKPQEEPKETPPAILDFTDDDLDYIAERGWADWVVNENYEDTSNNMFFYDDDAEDVSLDNEPPEEGLIEQEKAFSEYMDQTYELLMAFEINEKDKKALQQMMDDESFGFDEPDVNTGNNEQ